MIQLTLFSTSACHLCDEAHGLIEAQQNQTNFALKIVDIALSTRLVDLYGLKIPVLKRGTDDAELSWPFDDQDLRTFIGE